MGEAGGKLATDLKLGYPAGPGQDIKDFRNLLAQGDVGVDLEMPGTPSAMIYRY
jgi:uncharacterized protein with HEPN domain